VLALAFHGQHVGRLELARRAPGEEFTGAELRLFDGLARQIGVAAYAVALTADLQRSRERLVSAREEERRRLRRDLHDGLGPLLAGISLKLGAARNLLRGDPDAAEALLSELADEAQAAVGTCAESSTICGRRPSISWGWCRRSASRRHASTARWR
jgi:signal transduction histidine kinase